MTKKVRSIVFVHGLREVGLKAWTGSSSGTLWMRDLFPHSKYRTRSLIYEYDADVLITPGALAANGLYDEAVSLVNHLESERELSNAEERPLVFICHEFGGILVKRALAYSRSRGGANVEHLRSIYRSTYGIIFMATPHHGFTKESLLISHSNHQEGPSQFMLTLLEGSEVLQEVTDQFAPLMKDFRIYNFWEKHKTGSRNGAAFVVERGSAAPSWDVDQCGIRATNSGIAKFESRSSPGYRLVLATLEKYVKAAPGVIEKRWQRDRELVQEEREHEAQLLLSANHLFTQHQGQPLAVPSKTQPATTKDSEATTAESVPENLGVPAGEVTPPYANVHYFVRTRSEYFVGRQKQMDELRENFGTVRTKQGSKPKVFVIYGLPGSGKSQFCLRYLEERRHE